MSLMLGFTTFLCANETFRGPGVFYKRRDGDARERGIEKMNAYLDEIGSPVGPVAFATNEGGRCSA